MVTGALAQLHSAQILAFSQYYQGQTCTYRDIDVFFLDLLCKNITEKLKQENYNVSKLDNSSGHTLLVMGG